MRLEIDEIGGNCPVQAEGSIEGFGFYFRARGSYWTIDILDGSPDGWHYGEPYPGGQFAAGWMEESEARSFITMAAKKFVEREG